VVRRHRDLDLWRSEDPDRFVLLFCVEDRQASQEGLDSSFRLTPT
jgi:hypothetical protein